MEEPDHKAVPPPSPKRRRRGWGFWAFVILNVVGAILIIPLMIEVAPLVKVWWHTRSQESFSRHSEAVQNSKTNQTGAPSPTAALTNNLEVVEDLSAADLKEIIAFQFGQAEPSGSPTNQFDEVSAVFHSVTRKVATFEGQEFYCYEIDLVDRHGNHRTHVDCYEEPDLEYERTMATLELIDSNPQLRKIYGVFSDFVATRGSQTEPDAPDTSSNGPAFRLENGAWDELDNGSGPPAPQ